MWDAVTLCIPFGQNPDIFNNDLDLMKKLNLVNSKEWIIVNDACENVGSGGSTLNALLTTIELLCAKQSIPVLSEEIICNSRILIVLIGSRNAIENKICEDYLEIDSGYIYQSPLIRSIHNADLISSNSSKSNGVWIIGTDTNWCISKEIYTNFILSQSCITAFTFNGSSDLFATHGTYNYCALSDTVTGIDYCRSDDLNDAEQKPIALTFLYFPPSVAIIFLSFHNIYPISAATYYGIDSGAIGLKLSLFFDIILSTCDIQRSSFIEHRIGGNKVEKLNLDMMKNSRSFIYDAFSKIKTNLVFLSLSDYKSGIMEYQKRDLKHFYNSLLNFVRNSINGIFEMDLSKVLRTLVYINQLNGSDFSFWPTFKNHFSDEKIDFNKMTNAFYILSLAIFMEANGKGGLRIGPAANTIFLDLMQKYKQTMGKTQSEMNQCYLRILEEVEENWMNDPFRMIRAARHLEAAGAYHISQRVELMCKNNVLKLIPTTHDKRFTKVSSAARIDMFGGWLDTPPIFFNWDLVSVCNIAILVDGKYPISCEIEKTTEFGIELHQERIVVRFTENEQILETFNKPNRVGCLLCACMVSLGFRTIREFLDIFQCDGLKIRLISDLPHGSGLGTSSIMAVVILKAFGELAGFQKGDIPREQQFILTTLHIEQLMTTGGGWQDQAGAVYPGIKLTHCEKWNRDQWSRMIRCERIEIPESRSIELCRRLALIYTGKTRLAKNLLQDVIRNFHTDGSVFNVMKEMNEQCREFAEQLRNGGIDWPTQLTDKYHNYKNLISSCYEPPIVRKLFADLKTSRIIDSGCLAGAGGGGFAYVWLAKNVEIEKLREYLNLYYCDMTCNSIQICNNGFLIENY